GGGQRAQRRLTTRAGALDQHGHVLQAVLHRLGGRVARRHLGGERRRLARALEPARAGGRPGEHVPGNVGDGDDGAVERALDVDDARLHVLAGLLLRLLALLGRGGGGAGRRGGCAGGRRGRGLLLFGPFWLPQAPAVHR